MAQQEEGWPLGLEPLNVRVGLVRHRNFSGSTSFNTSLDGSPDSSTDFSSDLGTESTGSFFYNRGTTLGSLIGFYNLANLSRRSIRSRRGRNRGVAAGPKNCRSKTWCFSLCSKDTTDAESTNEDTQSLGHFLTVERRAANQHRRSHNPFIYGPDELGLAQPDTEPNSLFVDGHIAPPRPSSRSSQNTGKRQSNGIEHKNNGYGAMLLFRCICGHD